MADRIVIRPYAPQDRDAVRQVCCDTADHGEPVEHFFPDRETFADLLTNYYTEEEPQSVWVAEHAGQIVGYLTGCLDSRRYWRVVAWRIVPRAMGKAIGRNVLWSCQTWRFLWAGLQSCFYGGLQRKVPFDHYPAHLHLNIREGFRGQQLGRGLVEKFCEQVKNAGLSGIHVAISEENRAGCHFFERVGFALLSRHRIIRPDGGAGRRSSTLVYGKRL